jgi:hypothetical protein
VARTLGEIQDHYSDTIGKVVY